MSSSGVGACVGVRKPEPCLVVVRQLVPVGCVVGIVTMVGAPRVEVGCNGLVALRVVTLGAPPGACVGAGNVVSLPETPPFLIHPSEGLKWLRSWGEEERGL